MDRVKKGLYPKYMWDINPELIGTKNFDLIN
jgi:hypothetical protein